MKYVYVSANCSIFTGKTVEDFKNKGMDLLLEIMHKADFKALSYDLFPAMQEKYLELSLEDRKNTVFELYYRLIHAGTGMETPVVEYSSYARYDDEGSPTFSTGVIYESPLAMDGVRGIVRHIDSDAQTTLFDRCDFHALDVLTKTEKAIVQSFIKNQSRDCIAADLNISIHTVRTHFKNIYKKLDINKEADLLGVVKI
ncbi:hypothetical protein EJ995_08505 [Nonlabens ponticola]|uniref:HTH luxR-type domain-containing protein n=2 Tax=Nonlabens ponticola TaxID=2496866 RepID=A0A3S9N1B3_9FLAO|nr:hypothetical protein EJ995_08505 [Nonlabens ponticola]